MILNHFIFLQILLLKEHLMDSSAMLINNGGVETASIDENEVKSTDDIEEIMSQITDDMLLGFMEQQNVNNQIYIFEGITIPKQMVDYPSCDKIKYVEKTNTRGDEITKTRHMVAKTKIKCGELLDVEDPILMVDASLLKDAVNWQLTVAGMFSEMGKIFLKAGAGIPGGHEILENKMKEEAKESAGEGCPPPSRSDDIREGLFPEADQIEVINKFVPKITNLYPRSAPPTKKKDYLSFWAQKAKANFFPRVGSTLYATHLARYDHSCTPNVLVGTIDPITKRIGIFAGRDIEEGEFLNFSYFGSLPEDLKKRRHLIEDLGGFNCICDFCIKQETARNLGKEVELFREAEMTPHLYCVITQGKDKMGCAFCGKDPNVALNCKDCDVARYCKLDCKLKHAEVHKVMCEKSIEIKLSDGKTKITHRYETTWDKQQMLNNIINRWSDSFQYMTKEKVKRNLAEAWLRSIESQKDLDLEGLADESNIEIEEVTALSLT